MFQNRDILWAERKSDPLRIRKEKDMTAIIRFYSLNSEYFYAQLDKKELGKLCTCSFKDKYERINCVDGPECR